MAEYESDIELYNKLITKIKGYHPSNDLSLIEKAYNLAKVAHGNQLRRSGEPYIIHPLEVAIILADLQMDRETIVGAILHDVIEDTKYEYEDIVKLFGEEIAILVDGVTKLDKLDYSSKEEAQAENYRKMFLAMAKDIRVILIKLADRLHNMRTLKYMPPNKQKEKAQETLDIYAPLAHRLGISKIRIELEDLSLKYLEPDIYYDLAQKIERKQSERIDYVNKIVKDVKGKLDEAGINAFVEGRPKHFFSIYKKMVNQNKTLDQIFDLFAIRAIVDTIRDCYEVLGIMHEMYKPIPGRFKDYISMPKPNKYQSLHNTLVGPEGETFEVQIRTWEMHRTSEYGIAAHWKYKEDQNSASKNNTSHSTTSDEKLTWLREILEWQRELSDNKEFMAALKLDLDVFSDQVYAFTPRGEVKNLPTGSTPVDFAFMIHSAIGNKMVGARVNGKIVTFDYKIQNGDIVEILTSQNSKGPSRDWLKIVKSSQAKNKINQWFKKEDKEENILRGKDLLEKEAKRKGYDLNSIFKEEFKQNVTEKYGFGKWDSLCATVGHGGIKEGQVINKLFEEYEKEQKKEQRKNFSIEDMITQNKSNQKPSNSKSGIIIKGIGDVPVRFSKCCNPVPGDEIVGFVTRGRGVSIHRTDCVNIINLDEDERHRLLEAEWYKSEIKKLTYQAEIRVICNERLTLLMDISKVFTDETIPVKALNARTTKDHSSIFDVIIEIDNKQKLESVINKLLAVKDVKEVLRVTT